MPRIDKNGETIIASSGVNLDNFNIDSLIADSQNSLDIKRKEKGEIGATFIINLRQVTPNGLSAFNKEFEGILEGIEWTLDIQIYQIWIPLENVLEILHHKLYVANKIIIKHIDKEVVNTNKLLKRLKVDSIEKGTVSCQMWFQ